MRLIGVPYHAGVAIRLLSGLMTYGQNFRIFGNAVSGRSLIVVNFAEPPTECDVLVAADRLVAKEKNTVLEKGGTELFEALLVKWLADIDVEHLGTERIRQAAKLQAHVSSF